MWQTGACIAGAGSGDPPGKSGVVESPVGVGIVDDGLVYNHLGVEPCVLRYEARHLTVVHIRPVHPAAVALSSTHCEVPSGLGLAFPSSSLILTSDHTGLRAYIGATLSSCRPGVAAEDVDIWAEVLPLETDCLRPAWRRGIKSSRDTSECPIQYVFWAGNTGWRRCIQQSFKRARSAPSSRHILSQSALLSF